MPAQTPVPKGSPVSVIRASSSPPTDATRTEQETANLRRAQADVLTGLSRAFSEAMEDPEGVLRTVTQQVAELTGDGCAIRLIADDGQTFGPATGRHPNPLIDQLMKQLKGPVPRASATAAFDATIDRRRSIRLPLSSDLLGLPTEMLHHLQGHPLGVGVSAPLIARGRVIGVLTLIRITGESDFAVEDERFLHDLAGLTALALDNVFLAQRNQELVSQLKMLTARTDLLLNIAQEFSASILNRAVLLELIARRLVDAVGELATIRLTSDDGDWLEASSVAWHPDPEVRAATLRTLCSRVSVDDGPMAQVFASRLPLRIQDGHPDALGQRSVVLVPLLLGDRILGVASIGRLVPGRPYTNDDVELLKEIAAHAGLAIANSQLLSRPGSG